MSRLLFYPLQVVFKPSEQIPGQWIGHCLDFDVMSTGWTVPHAIAMVIEACGLVVDHDLGVGRDPLSRRAPKELWKEMKRIVKDGKPVTLVEVLYANSDFKSLSLHMVLGFDRQRHIETQEFSRPVAELACKGQGRICRKLPKP